MSILIKGMEMPTSCLSCPLQGGTADCRLTQKTYNWGLSERPSDCPLVPVPPHGRLGDLDKLADKLTELKTATAKENPPTDIHGFNNGIMCGFDVAIGEVRYYAPTIIPAEEGE